MLDVRRLRLLRELAHRGTIAAVAEALAFSPSAVSQQLTALEREAGVPLLERTGRRVALTPAATVLVGHAEAVLARLEQASAELAGARQGLAGPLRIGVYPSAARVVIPGALVALTAAHPGLEPMVVELDPAGVADALRAGELDVALIHDYDFVPSSVEPGVGSRPLFTEAMYLVAPASWPRVTAGPDATVIGGLHATDWIIAGPDTRCRAMAFGACRAAGFTPQVRHQIDDFDTVLAMVAVGQGVAILPDLALIDPPAGVSPHRLSMCRRTALAFRSGASGHPAVTAFTTAVQATLPARLQRCDHH